MQIRIDWKIIIFVLFFFIIKIEYLYILFLIFTIVHELSHMIVGIILGFKPLKFEIIPFGCRISFKIDIENYNMKVLKGTRSSLKSIIVAMAGPASNLLISIIFCINMKYALIIYVNIILTVINILPIYPLDGGRILKHVLVLLQGRRKALKYTDYISNIIIGILSMIGLWLSYEYRSIYLMLALVYLLYIRIKEHKRYLIKEKIYKKISQIMRD